jgi:dTDP-4-dehydrorhamnose 3,5-epimerase-like enzyme
MNNNERKPRLIEGGLHVDDRGILSFVNDFDFKEVERSYIVRSHRACQPRGWIGHKRDQKWFWVIQGTCQISVVQPDEWECPASNLPVERFVLSASKPSVLHIPAGYANASVNISEDAILMVFSTGRIEDAKTDDYRFALDTWPVIECSALDKAL